MNKTNFKVRAQQAGFTLIELIVVIVILGIMAATALPKFMDLGADARVAKMQAAAGSMKSVVAMTQAAWQAAGAPAAAGNYGGVAATAEGFPTAGAMAVAAGLTDYKVDSTTVATKADVTPDTEHTTCKVTYDEETGIVGAAPAAAVCG